MLKVSCRCLLLNCYFNSIQADKHFNPWMNTLVWIKSRCCVLALWFHPGKNIYTNTWSTKLISQIRHWPQLWKRFQTQLPNQRHSLKYQSIFEIILFWPGRLPFISNRRRLLFRLCSWQQPLSMHTFLKTTWLIMGVVPSASILPESAVPFFLKVCTQVLAATRKSTLKNRHLWLAIQLV